jgi:glutamyl/glutaminyl-tRNA synthetase
LGYPVPQFVHLPVITKNGKKMSKRDADPDGKAPVGVMDRAALGFLPEATLNHLALLGWTHPEQKEIFDVAELISRFDLKDLNKSNANFDEKRYLYFNSHYLSQKTDADVLALVRPYLLKAGLDLSLFCEKKLEQMVALEKVRCQILSAFPEALAYFFAPPTEFEEAGLKKDFFRTDADVAKILADTAAALATATAEDPAEIDRVLAESVAAQGIPYKIVGPIVRLALTGRTRSPALADMISVMGVIDAVRRLNYARRFIIDTRAEK